MPPNAMNALSSSQRLKKSEEAEAKRKPVCNEFAKGQSLVKANQEKPKNEPKQAPKQEYVKIGNELVPKEEAEQAEKRMFDTITEKMKHGELPPMGIEAKFRNEVKDGVKEMLDSFTWQENMMIAFVPLMIADMAWHYVDKVMKYCADRRISEVKKLGRAIKEVRQKYMDSLNQDLDFKHIENVQQHSNMFMNEFAKDFTIFWFQVNGAIKREYPNMEYSDMRTDACCCIFMIDFLKQHNSKMDEIIASKMGASNSIMHPDMLKLKILVDAYLPDKFEIKGKEQIDLALKIINKNLWNIDFKVEGE